MKNFKSLWLLLALVCFLPSSIFAYRCAMPTPKAEFARSNAVFSGKVVAQESRRAELQLADGQKKTKVVITATEFRVQNFWKGGGEKTAFLIDYRYADEADARFQIRRNIAFEINKSYLVYAYEFQNALQAAARCTNTKSLDAAINDLKQLGKGDAPTKTVDKTLKQVLTEFIDKWNN